MDAKVELVGLILFISLALTALARSPPIAKPCFKPHEKYEHCLLAGCSPRTCDDVGELVACSFVELSGCKGGCVCGEGYVWDKDGNCVDVKSCPSCGGDPNAVSGCGITCGRTCASLKSNTRNKTETSAVTSCVKSCQLNGCDCKTGYILNTDVYPPICVLPEDCNKPLNCTKPHERYIDCLAGQCYPRTCDDLGPVRRCPSIIGPCPGGCTCEEGYLRDSEGECIKLENCPQ